jgi:hypothetical protein
MKGKRYMAFVFLLAMMAFQLPTDTDTTKIAPLVATKLKEDIDRYYAERLRICKLEALLRAEDYVDSIIVNRINLNIMNGRKFPDRPVRPPSPGSILLDDTTVVAPIFKH